MRWMEWHGVADSKIGRGERNKNANKKKHKKREKAKRFAWYAIAICLVTKYCIGEYWMVWPFALVCVCVCMCWARLLSTIAIYCISKHFAVCRFTCAPLCSSHSEGPKCVHCFPRDLNKLHSRALTFILCHISAFFVPFFFAAFQFDFFFFVRLCLLNGVALSSSSALNSSKFHLQFFCLILICVSHFQRCDCVIPWWVATRKFAVFIIIFVLSSELICCTIHSFHDHQINILFFHQSDDVLDWIIMNIIFARK